VKKFVFLAHGEMDRTPEFQQAHRAWWSSIQDHVVDSGDPLFNGWNVTRDGTVSELAADESPALGYSIVEAENGRRHDRSASRVPDGPVGLRGDADVTRFGGG
jgi:hypothetical protein